MTFLLILLWSFAILIGYYFFHKPISPVQALALGQAALDLLLAGSILTAAGGMGRRLLRRAPLAGLERLAASAAVGLGILSLVWLGLGSLSLVYSWTAWLLLLLLLVLLRKDCLAWGNDFGALREIWIYSPVFEKILAFAAAFLAGIQLVFALAPPVKWDALTYHLDLPTGYIAAHAVRLNPANPYAGSPQLSEMLFTWAIQLHRPETAAVLAWGVGVLFLLGVLGLNQSLARAVFTSLSGDDLAKRAAITGWAALIAVLVGFTFRRMLGWAYTDLFSALFGAAILILLFAWFQSGTDRLWLWVGALCGWAVSVKWTSGAAVIGVFLIPLVFHRVRRLPIGIWLAGGAVALVIYAPWAAWDLAATGNPIYPFLIPTAIFPAWRVAAGNLAPEGLTWLSGAALPVALTWTGVDGALGFSTDIGPLLILLAIPALWLFRKNHETRALALILALVWTVIAIPGLRYGHLTQPRLYFAALPVLAILAGLGWAGLQALTLQGVRLRRILGAILALVCLLVIFQDTADLAGSTAPAAVLGAESQAAYRAVNLGDYAQLDEKLAALPAGARVLALWEPRMFYLPANTLADFWIDRWRTDSHEHSQAGDVLAQWRAQGITHLLVYLPGETFMRSSDPATSPQSWAEFDQLLQQLPAPVNVGGAYQIYPLP
jgi:4-amino-4-deoxy-L-arabinose transferase-like glycosyltransferase